MTHHRASIRVKCSPDAWPYVREMMDMISAGRGRVQIGIEPGSSWVETIDGHRLYATRLENGGIGIKEGPPRPRAPKTEAAAHGWAGVYDEKPA